MKAPCCGADSTVLATRKYKDVLLKRTRQCFNGHAVFVTYEVFSGNLDRRTLADTRRGIEAKMKSWQRREYVRKHPEETVSALATALDITGTRVRQIRASL